VSTGPLARPFNADCVERSAVTPRTPIAFDTARFAFVSSLQRCGLQAYTIASVVHNAYTPCERSMFREEDRAACSLASKRKILHFATRLFTITVRLLGAALRCWHEPGRTNEPARQTGNRKLWTRV
jgi:hypothetical protein